MHSFALINGQYQNVGSSKQAQNTASGAAHNATRNNTWTTAEAYQYIQTKAGEKPSHNGNVVSHRVNAQNYQNSAAPYQTSNSQQKGTEFSNDSIITMLLHYLPDPPASSQRGNSSLVSSSGSQAITQNCHRAIPTQSPLNTANASRWQDMSSCLNQRISYDGRQPAATVQNGQRVLYPQQNTAQQTLYRIENGGSLSREQAVGPISFVPVYAHNGKPTQMNCNQISRQNSTMSVFIPVCSSSYGAPISLSCGNSMTTQSSNAQSLYLSNTSQKTQQHTAQPGLPCNMWRNPTNSSNPKSNNLNENPNAVQQQKLRHNVNTYHLSKMNSAGSDMCPPPYYYSHHFSHKGRQNTCSQNTQPVTSVSSKNYNMNTTQSSQVPSGQSWSSSVLSVQQNPINMPPPQSSFPESLSGNGATNASRRDTAAATFLPNSTVSKGSQGQSLCNSPQAQVPQGVSSQTNKPKSLTESPLLLAEILGVQPPVKQNDCSAHSTAGHLGPKAVAVVQPLSQEKGQTSSNSTTCDSASHSDMECISPALAKNNCSESNLCPENPDQRGAVEAIPKDVPELTAKDSEPTNSTPNSEQDSNIAAAAPSEVPASQSCSTKDDKSNTPPSPSAIELTSLLTTPWTAKALKNVILVAEKGQAMTKWKTPAKTILEVWYEQYKSNQAFRNRYDSDWLKRASSNAEKFCHTHIGPDSVVMSKPQQGSEDQLKHFHVLQDGELYTELPYKSSWLNLNDKLDDIDKEFGFPWTFRQPPCVTDNGSQMDTEKTVSSEPIKKKVPNKETAQPESVASTEENDRSSTIECAPTSPSSNKSEGGNSSDFPYRFKIQVLPPEEAKVFYEQVQKESPQHTDDKDKGTGSESVQSKTPESTDDTLKKSATDQIDQICCLARLLEMHSGSSTPACKCHCMEELSQTECIDKTVGPDFDALTESEEGIDCQILTLAGPEHSKNLGKIIDLTEDEEHLTSSEQEAKAPSEICNSAQSDVIIIDDENDALSNNEHVIPSETIDLEAEISESTNDKHIIPSETIDLETEMSMSKDRFADDELKLAEAMQSSAPVSSPKQITFLDLFSTETDVGLQISDQKKDSGHCQLNTKAEAESTKEDTPIGRKTTNLSSHHGKYKKLEKKWKKQRRLNTFFSSQNTSKKYRFSNGMDSNHLSKVQHSSRGEKSVELMLFGSTKRGLSSCGNRIEHAPSSISLCQKIWPPEVLSVSLDPSKKTDTNAAPSKEYSVKQLIYEKWRNSLPTEGFLLKSRHRNELKMQRKRSAPLSGDNPRREKQPISSDMRDFDANRNCRLRVKKRKWLSSSFVVKKKRRKYSVLLEQCDSQSESQGSPPLQENIVMKFSVLPSSFDFKDGSDERKGISDAASDKPVQERDHASNTDYIKSKGTWYPTTDKQQQPNRIPRNSGLFHEYKKIFKERNRSSTD